MPVQSKSKSILTFSKELKTVFLNLSFKKNFDLEITTIYIQNCQIRHIIIYFFCKILHDSTKRTLDKNAYIVAIDFSFSKLSLLNLG